MFEHKLNYYYGTGMKKIFALLFIVLGLAAFVMQDKAYAQDINAFRVDWLVIKVDGSEYLASSTDPWNKEWKKKGDACDKITLNTGPRGASWTLQKYTNDSNLGIACKELGGPLNVKFTNGSNNNNNSVVYHWINSSTIERYKVGDLPSTTYTKTVLDGKSVFLENSTTCRDTFQITGSQNGFTKANYTGRNEDSPIKYAIYPSGFSYDYNTIDNGQKVGPCYEGTKQGGGNIATILISGVENKNKIASDFSGSLAGYTQGVSSSGDGTQTGEPGASSCAIEGIGWVVCPVVTFLSRVADYAFEFLSDNFLEFKAGFLDTQGDLFKAWSQVLTIANVGLVIFFLIIIFSQITGFGITNYGIKKMLPRLVIVAILMNLSFFLVQIAADVSNILGYSLKEFFSGIIDTSGYPEPEQNTFSGIGLVVLAGAGGAAAVAASGGVSGALVAFLPLLLAGVLAVLLIFFILVARQVLLILLTVIAPIAFLAFLLPNTEGWFTKWYKTLLALLLVFPIVGFVYGASELASQVISVTMSGSSGSVLGQVIGAAILVLPLFLVPVILKKSLDSIPAIAGKVNSLGSKVTGGAKSSAKQGMEKSYLGQKAAYNKQQAAINRAQIQSGTYNGRFGRFNPRNLASGTFGAFNGSRLSGEFGNSMTARGAALEQEENAKRDKEAAALIEKQGLSREDIKKLAMGIDARGLKANEHNRRAAIQQMMATGGVQDVHDVLGSVGTMSPGQRSVTTTSLASSSVNEKAPYLRGVLGDIGSGTVDLDKAARDSIIQGKITPEVLAGMDERAIQQLGVAAYSDENSSKLLDEAKLQLVEDDKLMQRVAPGSVKDITIRTLSQYHDLNPPKP